MALSLPMYLFTSAVVFGPRTANVTRCRFSGPNPLIPSPPSRTSRFLLQDSSRRRELSPCVLDALEQLVGVEDARQGVHVSYEVVIFHSVIGFAELDGLAEG